MPEPLITIADPIAVRAGRVSEDGRDWIVLTYEFEYDGRTEEARVALTPEGFGTMVVAGLNGLGFPESDLTYIAERLERINE